MIFAVLAGGLPNRLTAVAVSDVAFMPTRSGYFKEPALIRYLSVTASVMTRVEAFPSLLSASSGSRPTRRRGPGAVIVDIAAMPGADQRLSELIRRCRDTGRRL